MTHTYLTLDSVSCVLPDGRTLFSNLNAQFDQRKTALVGRNGVGKSLLGKIAAGRLAPSSGSRLCTGTVYYIGQQISLSASVCVADLAGVKSVIDALQRIEAGGVEPLDFDKVGERWDIRHRLQLALAQHGLGHLEIDRPAATLSGGEAMRVCLIGAYLAQAEFLILDEPSNHLDYSGRQALIDQLSAWPGGLLVISHDRALLTTMDRLVELSSLGLRSYGGDLSFYLQCKALEREQAEAQLVQAKHQRNRQELQMLALQTRLERQRARANKQAGNANQAKILLGRDKQRSEDTGGKQVKQQASHRQQLSQRVRQAAQQVEDSAAVCMQVPVPSNIHGKRLIELDSLELPCVAPAARYLSLIINSQQRVAITGPNGSGKSTLLRVLAGLQQPLAGQYQIQGAFAYLDQQLLCIDPAKSAIEHLQAANRQLKEGELRTHLAQLGLDAATVVQPCQLLSGGERLKVALACSLYGQKPPQLLMLDEPSNHLDFPSMQALEQALRAYRGALLVVSHDEVFLQQLGLTHRLAVSACGWALDSWQGVLPRG
ncbi:ABC-F family ATP-binding cassette domain-containing protein [Pseudomonas sp. EL_65y_Pfl2_R95]|uniref:ABC-F family ATP-binding cassette domain-containing protein n=1 Tax=Pseudomonas sp. EL_65y_Pfl2_R95 TaxID=3088698 RepID=UPI0030DC5593